MFYYWGDLTREDEEYCSECDDFHSPIASCHKHTVDFYKKLGGVLDGFDYQAYRCDCNNSGIKKQNTNNS